MKNKIILFSTSAIVLLILFLGGTKFYKIYEEKKYGFLAKENASLFVRDHSPTMGNLNAKVYIIEFLDPECESCRALYPHVKNTLKDFQDKVALVVRYAPFHRNSKIAVKALEAARKQGKYWEVLELLFKYQPHWGDHHNPQPDLIFEYLPQIGIDMEKLRADMKDPQIEQILAQDIADLKHLEVRKTPTFFVNGKPLKKFGMRYLREAIEEEVKVMYGD